MRNLSPAVKGLLIAACIFAVVMAAVVVVRQSGVLDRISAAGEPAAVVETPGTGTIPDGTWTVGKDIEPGTYRTAAAVTGCTWVIYKAGTSQKEIVNIDVDVTGRPTVVLEVGHEFQSRSCGKWAKE